MFNNIKLNFNNKYINFISYVQFFFLSIILVSIVTLHLQSLLKIQPFYCAYRFSACRKRGFYARPFIWITVPKLYEKLLNDALHPRLRQDDVCASFSFCH